jgi:ABC-type transport system involved in multi-copper enzyme maturation permease subunit
MTTIDWIGFTGVTILLIAYFLNLKDIMGKNSGIYLFLNLIGAAIACFASVLLKYMPFIILEGCWTIVSAVGLFSLWKKKKKAVIFIF